MTIWFAQNSNVNIDSANMWNDVANGSGSFLTFANLGASDILVANNRTNIAINVDFTCLRITTSNADGGTAGGGPFTLGAGRTITCNVVAGTTTCVVRSLAGATSTVIGNTTGGSSTQIHGVRNDSASTVVVIGNVIGGSGLQANGVRNNADGSVEVVGQCSGGAGSNAAGLWNQATGTCNVVGNVIGTTSFGAWNNAQGVISVNGDVIGSAFVGAQNSGSGAVVVVGNVVGQLAVAVLNNSIGNVLVYGDCLASNSSPAVDNASTGIIRVDGNFVSASNGRLPTARGIVVIADTSPVIWQFRSGTAIGIVGGPRDLYTANAAPIEILPAESNVRFGTVYASNLRTGTLRVPAPEFVNAGVLVDDTVGTLMPNFTRQEMEESIISATATAIQDADLVTASMVTGGSVKSAKRTIDDETPLRFVWPTDDATITVERSINSAAYEAASGTVTFFRTEGVHHWYKLSYNAADRALGVVRYRLNDGVTTRYMTLQVEPVATTAQLTDTKNELVSEIGDIPDDILDSQRLVDQVVFSANTGFVTIDSLAGSLATANRLNDCLIRITDSDDRIQLRWIRAHYISSGVRAGFNPDLDFVPTPAVGDRVEIFNLYRGASNVVNWRGNVPNTLTSGRVDVLVGSMANNVVTTASINNGALTEAKFSTGFFGSIWSHATRTLTEVGNSTGVNTLLERIVGLIRTKAEDEVADSATADAIANIDLSTVATPQDVADARDAVIARGDEAWRTAITPGNWAITRSFATVDGSVVGVQMLLVGVAGKVVTSNANGLATLKVDNGSYVLRYTVPVFYEDIPDEPITIDDADDIAAEPITLVRKSLPPLSNNLLCLCTVTAINQHGDPAVDAAVVAETKNIGADDDQIFVFNEEREYWTDARGQAALPLLRNHRYAITVTFADFGSRTVLRTIPDQSDFHVLVKQ